MRDDGFAENEDDVNSEEAATIESHGVQIVHRSLVLREGLQVRAAHERAPRAGRIRTGIPTSRRTILRYCTGTVTFTG